LKAEVENGYYNLILTGAQAVVTGSGAELDTVSNEMAASYQRVWKIDSEALAYPNAEAVRKLLVGLLPAGAIILLPHNSFGLDLGPGLSIKLVCAYVPDAVSFEGTEGDILKIARQEYNGMVSTHVQCDISAGAVFTCRPGSFQADESKSAAGQVVDKSSEADDLSVKRRFIEVVEAEIGDVLWTESKSSYKTLRFMNGIWSYELIRWREINW